MFLFTLFYIEIQNVPLFPAISEEFILGRILTKLPEIVFEVRSSAEI